MQCGCRAAQPRTLSAGLFADAHGVFFSLLLPLNMNKMLQQNLPVIKSDAREQIQNQGQNAPNGWSFHQRLASFMLAEAARSLGKNILSLMAAPPFPCVSVGVDGEKPQRVKSNFPPHDKCRNIWRQMLRE